MTTTENEATGVQLPEGATGSSLLHDVLQAALEQFPEALNAAALPVGSRAFKTGFDEALARYEAARVASSERSAIARCIVDRTSAAVRFVSKDGAEPLSAVMQRRVEPLSLRVVGGTESPVGELVIPYGRQALGPADFGALGRDLVRRAGATEGVARALRWIGESAMECRGRLDLRGHRFVVLGAGAELAPTELLLRAGASVLWIDVKPPPPSLTDRPLCGRLFIADDADLLQRPVAVKSTIDDFSREGPVHLGLYAYAPGGSREWRLTAAMNAIVAALEPDRVASVSLLISPTTVAPLEPEDVEAATRRSAARPSWQTALLRSGVLSEAPLRAGSVRVARSVVSLQGAAYQAAQYVGKVLTAEAFAAYGPALDARQRRPLRVSANVAGITRTRSLSHPLFNAAFNGASRFGIEIFEPETTRALSGILAIHDLLNDASPAARAVADPLEVPGLFGQQVHGGVRSLPYALGSAIRVAALIGAGKNPMVLLRKKRQSPAVAL